MRIAIPVKDGSIFGHFGQASTFLLIDLVDGTFRERREVSVPEGTGHGAIADFLATQGVTQVIAGGMGAGMLQRLQGSNIQVVTGASGSPDEALASFAGGTLKSAGASSCEGHHHNDDDHGKGHSCCHH